MKYMYIKTVGVDRVEIPFTKDKFYNLIEKIYSKKYNGYRYFFIDNNNVKHEISEYFLSEYFISNTKLRKEKIQRLMK